jgi:hypothetical protein
VVANKLANKQDKWLKSLVAQKLPKRGLQCNSLFLFAKNAKIVYKKQGKITH